MEIVDLEDEPSQALNAYTQEDYVGKIIYDSPTCWDSTCCNSDGVIAVVGKSTVHLYSPQMQHQFFFATSWIKIDFVEENAAIGVLESDVAWLATHALNENAMYLKQICWFEMVHQQPILFVLTNIGQLFGFVEDSLSYNQNLTLDFITRTVKVQANGFRMILSPLAFGEAGDYILHDCFDVVDGRRNLLVSSSETDVYVWEMTVNEDSGAVVPVRRSLVDIATTTTGAGTAVTGPFVKIAICFDDSNSSERLSIVCANRWGSCYFLQTTGPDLALTLMRSLNFEGSLEALYLSSRLLLVVSSVCMLAIHRNANEKQQQRAMTPHSKAMTSLKPSYSSLFGRGEQDNSDCFVSCSLDGSIVWWRLTTPTAAAAAANDNDNVVILHHMSLPHAEFGYYGIASDPLTMCFFAVHRQPANHDNSRDVQLNSSLLRPHMMLSYHLHYSLKECRLCPQTGENVEEIVKDDLTAILTQAMTIFAHKKKQKQSTAAAHVVLSLWLMFLEQKAHFARLSLPPMPAAIAAREEFMRVHYGKWQQTQQHEGELEEKEEELTEYLNKVRNREKKLLRKQREELQRQDDGEDEGEAAFSDTLEASERGAEDEDEALMTSDSEVSISFSKGALKKIPAPSSSSASKTTKKKATGKKNEDSDDDDDATAATTGNQPSSYGMADLVQALRDYMPPTFVELANMASEKMLESCRHGLCQLCSIDVAIVKSVSDLSTDVILSSAADNETMQKILSLCILTHVCVLSFHQIADQPLSKFVKEQVDDLQRKMMVMHAMQALTRLNQTLAQDAAVCPSLVQWTMFDRWLQFLSSAVPQHLVTRQSEKTRQESTRKWRPQQLALLKDRCFVCNDIILFEAETAPSGTCSSCSTITERCPFTMILATTNTMVDDNCFHVNADTIVACPVCKASTNTQLWQQYCQGSNGYAGRVVQCPFCAVTMKQLMA